MWETKCYTYKHYYQIILQDNGWVWIEYIECVYEWTYYVYIFYWKLSNRVKLGVKTCILGYILKMSHNFPKKAINLAYFTKNNKKCENKCSLQLWFNGRFEYG